MSFRRKLYDYLRGQLVKESKKSLGADLKCPGCHGWFSETAIDYDFKIFYESLDSTNTVYQCGRCKEYSCWDFGVMPAAVLVKHWRP